MKSLVLILTGMFLCWHYTDLASDGTLQGVLAPLGFIFFLVSLLIWLILRLPLGRGSSDSGYIDSGGGGDWGGGDGGGGGGD
ncbi:MAG: hypothetical protein QNJ69_12195 [Gammaproteobacteria bacterium]|nr:hypothetical protein [Gammaproteobacteria bacterium]